MQQDFQNDTIVALATPAGTGAIAVIRLSGPDSIRIVNKVFHGKNLEEQPSHTLHLGTINDGETLIDEVLVSLFIAPRSYTKEHSAEVSCHASPYIIDRLIRLFIREGARAAKPGEFTQRAFLNGQLDLSQAEAVADLIASTSGASHRVALQQLRGGISGKLQQLREQLIQFASLIELELDFSEEDVEFANREQLSSLVHQIRLELGRMISSFELGNAIKSGLPVVISGKPNAGKSTLLNALLNEERAIVSDIPGTTRDIIEDELVIGGIRFRFIDTAGIRETTDKIEAIGVERAYGKIKQSAIVLYLFDPREVSPVELGGILDEIRTHMAKPENLLAVANKIDLLESEKVRSDYSFAENLLLISAREQQNITILTDALLEKAQAARLDSDETIISNIRHIEALTRTDEALANALEMMEQLVSGELLAFEIRQALHYLGEITGSISNEDLLDSIFSKFCIGK
ncbi:tRNA modification GTPase trmE [Anseongella ginsenosidimutans]|uniref:tRNA modification GTPase MnmE n=1 Tax=Anseongella ginsenosidimutans TaxID=496056 RepID=A0A4R3KWP8_9SPHI|nr:tRNA uridine-5-carboxymethylaminomethyl(34) synthesis GTPase MnmE [Anseongella ginsenosidimutans]QEC53459.1 tRNA uridine-5-carboxymethylaminomethyl(34) synthesis GTPase MnmE [Anseongella ginsenosidimutans]TCS88351.1 tRNA modification GTPase trmE [Anseongella ginsenosidimutans]